MYFAFYTDNLSFVCMRLSIRLKTFLLVPWFIFYFLWLAKSIIWWNMKWITQVGRDRWFQKVLQIWIRSIKSQLLLQFFKILHLSNSRVLWIIFPKAFQLHNWNFEFLKIFWAKIVSIIWIWLALGYAGVVGETTIVKMFQNSTL